MNTQPSSREAAQRRRKRRLRRHGQSLVEYALTLALMALVAQGTMRTVYRSVATVVTNLRSGMNSADDRTPTPGPSPTVRFPPAPPTLTALPATATVLAKCTVPDLSNLQYQAAVAEWVNYGFSAGTLSKPNGKTTNFVVGTQSLTKGAPVFCTSSMTVDAKTCKIPNLADQVFSAARAGAWTTSGFFTDNLVPPNKVTDTAFPIGSQQYAANTTVDCDITMQVDPKMCTVPNLSGKTFNISGVGTAHTTWSTNNFIAANLTRQAGAPDTFTVGPNTHTVQSQSLTVGDSVYCNTPMEVWPALCEVPNVVGSTYVAAKTAWGNKGFVTVLQQAANTPAAFTIASQSQTATTTLDCATTTMTVQPKMCTVPIMNGVLYSAATATGGVWTNALFSSTLAKSWSTSPTDRTIRSTTPPAGSLVACSDVTVTASNTSCTVPNLQNMLFSAASAKWTLDGFTSALARGATAPASGDFTVDTQTFTANGSQACSSTMSVGPKMCTVPNMFDHQVSVALSDWTAAGFTAGNLTNSTGGAQNTWWVTGQTLTVGSSKACETSTGTLTSAATTLVVSVTSPGNEDSRSLSNNTAPRIKARAYDSNVTGGNQGIDRVVFTITKKVGGSAAQTVEVTSDTTYYCAYGPANPDSSQNCTRGFSPTWNDLLATGDYEITATAYSTDPNKGSVISAPVTFTVKN